MSFSAVAAALAATVALACLALAGPAQAQDLKRPDSLDRPPSLFKRTGNDVIEIARRGEGIRAEVAKHPTAKPEVFTKGSGRWQVSWFTKKPRKEIAQVLIDDRSGAILEAWTGYKV